MLSKGVFDLRNNSVIKTPIIKGTINISHLAEMAPDKTKKEVRYQKAPSINAQPE